jgi:hydroxymethylpyrimidine pyrophosphatase-like HAD family hydrolase
MSDMLMLAADLDNTLIHGAPRAGDVPVEYADDGAVITYMTARAREALADFQRYGALVPVTARSVEQYRRVRVFREFPPRYAIAAMGAVLLENDRIDEAWKARTRRIVRARRTALEAAADTLRRTKCVARTRFVDEAFLFARADTGEAAAAVARALRESRDAADFTIFHYHQKIYMVPLGIDKGTAVAEVRARLSSKGAVALIGAGDSEPDISFLKIADAALVPTADFAKRLAESTSGAAVPPEIIVRPPDADFASFIFNCALRQ